MVMYDVARPSLVSLAFGWVGDQLGNITLSHVREDIHTLYLTYIHSCIYTYIHTTDIHHSLIYLFIEAISIAPLQVHYYSEASRNSTDAVLEFHAEAPQATAQGSYVAA